ncbi:MAG TPA: hypothetical protein VI959_02570, partial [Alphaproteobacteria bacterium]|nr:hypothetical protein [Alphaproteobacteria bacterium]
VIIEDDLENLTLSGKVVMHPNLLGLNRMPLVHIPPSITLGPTSIFLVIKTKKQLSREIENWIY